ncbi:UxaA family hydrolase [Sphingomonas sp. RS2018]
MTETSTAVAPRATFRIDPRDDVATALRPLASGETGEGVVLRQDIAFGHKFALRDLAAGAPVLKFGYPIGIATRAIAAGEHVHVHNVRTALATSGAYRYAPLSPEPPAPSTRSFLGYRRADGRVATRNEIWVIPTVGCVARTAQKIAQAADALHAGTIDGVQALVHPYGCSQLGDDLDGTTAILAALAQHPNAAGVVLVGLGCESNQLDRLMAAIDPSAHPRIRTVRAQTSTDEVAEGLAHVADLVAQVGGAAREPVPLSDLVLGVKCGGSDGFSGLTANPLVGRMSDAVTGAGGAAILTEIPEVFGAEQLLMDRATSEDVFDGIVALVNGFKGYFVAHGEPVSENPSPGNIAGGITTLEEKSLGAVQKAGRATVTDVRHYGERVRRTGLTLLEAPGNDAVSCTALAAAGATAILFTTGRGTPLGFPVPTIKIASNTALAERKPNWIDFDAGRVLTEGDGATDALLDLVTGIASGSATKAERNGEREIAIWKRGVTL